MKIKKFSQINESYNYKPTDKVLHVSIEDFDVPLMDIEKTEAYKRALSDHINNQGRPYYPNVTLKEAKESSIMYGIEEWVYTSGNAKINWKLFDGSGNPIEDEEVFDNSIKYNL